MTQKTLIVDDEPHIRLLLAQTLEELEEEDVEILTAKRQEFDRQRGQAVGADIYMTKPFDPDEVMAKAREVLQLSP